MAWLQQLSDELEQRKDVEMDLEAILKDATPLEQERYDEEYDWMLRYRSLQYNNSLGITSK